MSKFSAMRSERATKPTANENATAEAAAPTQAKPTKPSGRDGKKMVGAYFAPEVSLELARLGLDLGGRTLQSLLGEAVDDLLRKHGKHPFGLS